MLAHRLETTIRHDRTLTLENLPFPSGEVVEVIILSRARSVPLASPKVLEQNKYSLRGTPIQYINPTEPIEQEDWEVLR